MACDASSFFGGIGSYMMRGTSSCYWCALFFEDAGTRFPVGLGGTFEHNCSEELNCFLNSFLKLCSLSVPPIPKCGLATRTTSAVKLYRRRRVGGSESPMAVPTP